MMIVRHGKVKINVCFYPVMMNVSVQDAHNCILDFDEDTAMFAVYDGHGGTFSPSQTPFFSF